MARARAFNFVGFVLHLFLVVTGAMLLTLAVFLVLPFMQSIAKSPTTQLFVQTADVASLPPPPPPPEEEPPEEEEPEEEPPELADDAPPLDLSQLELALNPGLSGDWLGGDMAVKINVVTAGGDDVDALFAISDLDQKPRVIYQPGPIYNNQIRKRAPGKVYVVFVVNQRGRVEDLKVQSSTDPTFEPAALAAVRQWKFEPGKRNGQAVRFRMRAPITFPKNS